MLPGCVMYMSLDLEMNGKMLINTLLYLQMAGPGIVSPLFLLEKTVLGL